MFCEELVNSFNNSLLSVITKASGQENVFYSPYSIMSAFAMILAGARGNTEANLQAGLKLTGLGRAQIAEAFKQSIASLCSSNTEHELRIANKIMVQLDFKLLQEYLVILEENFKASIETRKLDTAETVKAINEWVADETKGMIKEILKIIPPPGTKMLLANAIYFKGKWQKKFKPRLTKPRPFRSIYGTSKDVPTMSIKMVIKVYKGPKYYVFALPYKGPTSMVIMLPLDMGNLDRILREEKNTNFMAELSGGYNEKVKLYLPKFKFELETELISVLKNLGIEDVFSPTKSDLTGVSSQGGLYIGEAIHKAAVEVDEKGTRAAAVTAAVPKGGKYSLPKPPLKLHVDHPFLFYIVDQESKLILFTGRVNKL